MNAAKPSFADSIPFYMSAETSVECLRQSQERRAKHLRAAAVRDEMAKQILAKALAEKNMRAGSDRRQAIDANALAALAEDRRVNVDRRRFSYESPEPIYTPQ